LIFAAMPWRNSAKIKFNKVAARDGRMIIALLRQSLLRAGVNEQHRTSRGSQGSRCSAADRALYRAKELGRNRLEHETVMPDTEQTESSVSQIP
jgi:hypothetical protein